MTNTKQRSLFAFGVFALLTLQTACAQSTSQRIPSGDPILASVPASSPRTIGVTASPDLNYVGQPISPRYRVSRSTLEAAMTGFEQGAGKTILGLGSIFGPDGIVLGFMIYPAAAVIGAGVGAFNAASETVDHSLAYPQGGIQLQNGIREEKRIEEAIRDEIVAFGNVMAEHRLVILPHEQFSYERVSYQPNSVVRAELAALGVDEIIDIHVSDFAFVGKEGANPRVGLKIALRALCYLKGRPIVTLTAKYEGQRRTVNAWTAHGGRLLRDELRIAVRSLAAEVAENHLRGGSTPTRLTSAKPSKILLAVK